MLLLMLAATTVSLPPFPFTPSPAWPHNGDREILLLQNVFQTDPDHVEPVGRAPALVRVRASLSGIRLEAGSGADAVLGVAAGLWRDPLRGIEVVAGLDDILTSTTAHLFGVRDSLGVRRDRAWVAARWQSRLIEARAGWGFRTRDAEALHEPWIGLGGRLPLRLSWSAESWWIRGPHISAGLSLDLGQLRAAAGFSELQSWVVQNGSIGWHAKPPIGAEDGRDNPGVWMMLTRSWGTTPSTRPTASGQPLKDGSTDKTSEDSLPKAPSTRKPLELAETFVTESQLDERWVRRETRRDLQELAVRIHGGGPSDPAITSLLRQRLLLSGPGSHHEMTAIALDSTWSLDTRVQALATMAKVIPLDSALWSSAAASAEPRLRSEAALAVRGRTEPWAVTTLRILANDPEVEVRRAAGASGHVDLPGSQPVLEPATDPVRPW